MSALHDGPVFEPAFYMRRALKLFEECRKQLGDEVELLHDVHERVSPNQAVQFAEGRRAVQNVFHGGSAVAGGHRVLPPDPRRSAPRRSRWANCSTARTSGLR